MFMKRFLRFCLIATGLAAAAGRMGYAQPNRSGADLEYGFLQHILKNGQSLTMTYYPIEQMQSYIDQVLSKHQMPDVKTGRQTRRIKITMQSAAQCDSLLMAVQKDGFRIIVFSLQEESSCAAYRLEPKIFSSRRFGTSRIERQ